jgi:energy-coupling factor transporter ATP-binding protein EcfA2
MSLKKLTILGLFDRHDIVLDLEKRPLIVVGPNGSGKSTALTILHCLVTGQWQRLTRLPFAAVWAEFGGDGIFLAREDFETISRLRHMVYAPPGRLLPLDWELALKLVRRPRANQIEEDSSFVERYKDYAKVSNFAEVEMKGRVLYYPTYRRIERDLSELFEIDEDISEFPFDFEGPIRRRFASFGEVIGFGGQDISSLIERSVNDVENIARQALNQHSIKFLDALNKPDSLENRGLRTQVLDQARVSKLIDKINTFSPGSIDTVALTDSLANLRAKIIRGKQGRLRINEDILIYYVAELMNVMERIDANARPIHQFCDYISAYLKPSKSATFDEKDFSVHIRSIDGVDVDLQNLSSGEKQILSLFAFLMFSPPPRGTMLIIDEPELSLSVSWQKRLMSDLISTGRPDIIVAATHSPFIFERFPLNDVVSLGEI